MTENSRILLVDDDPDIVEVLGYNFTEEGFEVRSTNNGRSAIEIAREFRPRLILLDILMPEMDGIETCKRIRQIPECRDVLIVFLSAQEEDYTQITGFEAGSDDYVVKPFSIKVLMSRIKALLRRKELVRIENQGNNEEGDSLVVNREYYMVYKNDREISLPRKEFEILSFIASQPNRLFSREEIFNHIWGTDTIVGDRTLDVHIRKIRSRIGDDYIRTVKGVGYKFVQA